MLVLTRRVGEAIIIANNVTVRLIEVRGGRARLAIDAPANIRIQRSSDGPLQNHSPAVFQPSPVPHRG